MSERDRFVQGMLNRVGGPYCAYPGFTPTCADCSGTIAQEHVKATGRAIPSSSQAQAKLGVSAGSDWMEWEPGDILVYLGGEHTGVYVGNGRAVHAMNEQMGVVNSNVNTDYWKSNFDDARRLEWTGASEPPKGGSVAFGNVKIPTHDVRIVVKPWEQAGFDRVPPRHNVGMCMHKWWGFGTKYSLYNLFSTGGERQADALTDWSLTQEGELVMLNEPWKTRAGWANGPANHLEGDGVLFVRKLGVSAVNSRLVSVEFEGKDEPLTQAQMEIGSDLWAYYYDAWKVPWDVYPINPAVDCVTDLDHWEIGDKECPFAGARGQRHDFQSLVKGKLKAGQTGEETGPVAPDPEPDHEWLPEGFTENDLARLFGVGIQEDTTKLIKKEFRFDKKGLISNAWIAQSEKYGMWPSAVHWWKLQDTVNTTLVRNVVSFSNGWVLMGNDGDRASWDWR